MRFDWPRSIASLASALLASHVQAAAFLVGTTTPDPPTGAPEPVAAPVARPAATAGEGIRWTLGPIRYQGNLALDFRRSTVDNSGTSDSQLLLGEIQFSSYVWQPWFARVSSSVGFLASRSTTSGGESDGGTSTGLTGTGTLDLRIFPFSRFPAGLSLSVGDSRTTGESFASDYRVYRLGFNQSYRPAVGNDNYTLNLDWSRAQVSVDNGRDTLLSLTATSGHRWEDHTLDTSAAFSRNWQSTTDTSSRVGAVFARHTYAPDSAFSADTLASWTDTRLGSGLGGNLGSGQLLQISSTFNWRPREDDWLYHPTAPASLVGSVRLSESQSSGGGSRSQTFGGTAGISKQFSSILRGSASLGYVSQSTPGSAQFNQSSASAMLVYSPSTMVNLGPWRYSPSASSAVSGSAINGDQQTVLTLQAAHSLSRLWQLGTYDSVNLVVTQSAGGLQQWPRNQHSYGLSHSLGGTWNGFGQSGTQTLVGVTVSDSRTWSPTFGQATFQMVNLQLSRREQLSRFMSWSANLTAQATRNTASEQDIDAATGTRIASGEGWQRFYTGTVAFEAGRVFGVPRLNFALLLSGSTQQLDQRRLGDPNAPFESVTESAEARLDYSIGRLEARLSARAAKVDGRKVNALAARVQRRF